MIVQPVTVNLPAVLYDRLKRRAEQSNSTIEAEVLQAVTFAVASEEELDPETSETLSQLKLLDDEGLRRAAKSHLAGDVVQQLEDLHLKRQSEGLTAEEEQVASGLVKQYERAMLVRAEARTLLQERGADISDPGKS